MLTRLTLWACIGIIINAMQIEINALSICLMIIVGLIEHLSKMDGLTMGRAETLVCMSIAVNDMPRAIKLCSEITGVNPNEVDVKEDDI